MSYNLQDRIQSRIKRQEYRSMLDDQIREKYINDSNRRRIDTQPITNAHSYQKNRYPYSSQTPNHHNRKFIEHSTFLPPINRPNRSFIRPNHRRQMSGDIFEQTPLTTIDNQTDFETMQYLGECQRIIQNLKKLTNSSTKRIMRNNKNNKFNNQYGGRMQTEPAEPDYHYNQHAYDRFKDQNKAGKEILHIGVPESPYCQKKSQRSSHGSSAYVGHIHKNQVKYGNGKERSFSNQFDQISEFNEGNAHPSNRYQSKKSTIDHEQNRKFFTEVKDNKNNEDDHKEKQKARQRQMQKKRHEMMIKFLNQAKKRGSNLQQKVTQHKLKFSRPGKRLKNMRKQPYKQEENDEDDSKKIDKQSQDEDQQQDEKKTQKSQDGNKDNKQKEQQGSEEGSESKKSQQKKNQQQSDQSSSDDEKQSKKSKQKSQKESNKDSKEDEQDSDSDKQGSKKQKGSDFSKSQNQEESQKQKEKHQQQEQVKKSDSDKQGSKKQKGSDCSKSQNKEKPKNQKEKHEQQEQEQQQKNKKSQQKQQNSDKKSDKDHKQANS